MKAVKITAEYKAELIEVPTPKAISEFAVVKIHTAPMCTEVGAFKAGNMFHPFGHEAVGHVVEVAQESMVKVGDRMVVMPFYACGQCSLCRAGEYIYCEDNVDMEEFTGSEWGTDCFAEYIIKPDRLLVPIPNDISDVHASMACCGLGPSFGAMQVMNVHAFDTVLITGLGPVGLGAVINAKWRGARVIGIESNLYRTELAVKLGADVVLSPNSPDLITHIKNTTTGGADKAVECSGNGLAVQTCLQSVRRRGHVALIGAPAEFTSCSWPDFIPNGLTLHGCWHWNMADCSKIFRIVRETGDKLDQLITHQFTLNQIQEAFELQLTSQCGKVLLNPQG